VSQTLGPNQVWSVGPSNDINPVLTEPTGLSTMEAICLAVTQVGFTPVVLCYMLFHLFNSVSHFTKSLETLEIKTPLYSTMPGSTTETTELLLNGNWPTNALLLHLQSQIDGHCAGGQICSLNIGGGTSPCPPVAPFSNHCGKIGTLK